MGVAAVRGQPGPQQRGLRVEDGVVDGEVAAGRLQVTSNLVQLRARPRHYHPHSLRLGRHQVTQLRGPGLPDRGRPGQQVRGTPVVELSTNFREVSQCPEKAPTRERS